MMEVVELQSKLLMTRASLTWIFIIAVMTAIGSEIKIMPFANTTFRFGLGTIVFFLCTLIKPTPIILAGVATSIVTTIFRVLIRHYMMFRFLRVYLTIYQPVYFMYCLHYACKF